jgi:hypothetical protein
MIVAEDIHVLLLDYTSPISLSKALISLQLLHSRVKHITIINKGDLVPSLHIPALPQPVTYQKIIAGNLGKTIQQLVRASGCEYTLFLYDHDYLTEKIQHVLLQLEKDNMMMVDSYRVRDLTIQRPFLVKTRLLQQSSSLLERQVPFKEAVLPCWFSRLNAVNTIMISEGAVKQTRSVANHTSFYKQEMIQKYFSRPINLTESPSISIMLANYNMEQYIDISLASCFYQTVQPDQILVIDDGSRDRSYEKIQKWNGVIPLESFQQINSGKARAFNQLLPQIKSDFVLELDADDWLDPDAMAVLKQHLAHLSEEVSVLYGNLRFWKQQNNGDVIFKGIRKGKPVHNQQDLIEYPFPLGPRIYRTSALKENGGFPVKDFQDGRLYEDVLVLNDLLKKGRLHYENFTIYNVRRHHASITKKNHSKWSEFIKYLD